MSFKIPYLLNHIFSVSDHNDIMMVPEKKKIIHELITNAIKWPEESSVPETNLNIFIDKIIYVVLV